LTERCHSGLLVLMDHQTHPDHDHEHRAGCGHTAIKHDGHVDYLHDGHLHSAHGDHVDEHALASSDQQSASCGAHTCAGHGTEHRHGADCGHEVVPHAGHTDYLVASHLHNQHDDHCDDHGAVALA